MDKKKKKWIITFIPIFLILFFIIGVFYFTYEFDCGNDTSCYDRHLDTCKKTRLAIVDEGSTFEYKILGKESNECKIKVTLLDMPPETDIDTRNLFEGKSMTCLIGKDNDFNTEILPLCTGPLKEAIYELTIQKIYNILAQSLGDIISKV